MDSLKLVGSEEIGRKSNISSNSHDNSFGLMSPSSPKDN